MCVSQDRCVVYLGTIILGARQRAYTACVQDVERGTFSHRHAVVHDQVTARFTHDSIFCPLKAEPQLQHNTVVLHTSPRDVGGLATQILSTDSD